MRYALFLLLAVSINIVDGLLTRAAAGTPRSGIVTVAATIDPTEPALADSIYSRDAFVEA